MRLDLILCDSDTGGPILTDCKEAGWVTNVYSSVEEFLSGVDTSPPPLIILSLPMKWSKIKTEDEISRLKEWHAENPHTQIILIAPKGHQAADRFALKLGARHSLFSPYESKDLTGILSKIARGLGKRKQIDAINMHLRRPEGFDEIVGESKKIQEVLQLAKKVGKSEFTSLMITGENGTGKGALAKAIHQISSRASEPFIEVNCAAIPKNLLESEFFGHEKGAFTDAKERKMGLFELANGGTIFLDEIGEIDYALQAKLLKFLDSRTIRRVSGTQFLPVDVNIISATNRDLKDLIDSSRFRIDLFYRLNVIEITLPPLRDRVEDIRPIALKYTEKFAANLKKGKPRLSEEACRSLEEYSWPGNIRELINLIERAVLLDTDGEINPEDLPIQKEIKETTLNIEEGEETLKINIPSEGVSLEGVEKGLILATLEQTGGNITRAAGLLKVERGTLRYKMKKYGIKAAEHEQKNGTGKYKPISVTS
ncbi:MAG: sigma-54-dependent Fis family transcriptional regulator [Candidatus Krumholzibacteriota bacterium]|nr:sigma-54-dependent Fis family transcriptional regulator [Candidatus Krumholzibacteriota bacterium]